MVNADTAGPQFGPTITTLKNGDFVVAWTSYGQDGSQNGVFGRQYSPNAMPRGSEFQINTYTNGEQTAPLITALAGGGYVVVWASVGQDGSSSGLFGQRYDASGTRVGSEFQVNTYTNSWQTEPSVIALSSGGFVVTWTSAFQEDGLSYGIYGQRYDASGVPAGSEFRVNSHIAGDQEQSSSAALVGGGFVVAWTSHDQDGSGQGVYGQLYGADGNPIGQEFLANTYTWQDQWGPLSIEALPDGGFVMTWVSDVQSGGQQGLYGQRYDKNGNAVGAEFEADYDYQEYYTELQDGTFLGIMDKVPEGGSDPDIYYQRYRLNDTPEANPIVLPNGAQNTPVRITEAQLLAGASDVNGDALSIADLYVLSGSGSLVNNGDGSWTFTPRKDFSGSVILGYAVTDGSDPIFSTATFGFYQANHAPSVVQSSGTVVAENSANGEVIGTLVAPDIDGDAVTFSLVDNAGDRFAIANGKLVVARGTLLDYEQAASHQVTVRATDSQGASIDQSFNISIANVFNEVTSGSAGADRIVGDAGKDKLSGGSGNDTLTGGAGRDVFVFDTKLGNYKTDRQVNFDKITDFNVKDDSIYLDNAIFKKLGKGSPSMPGKLKEQFFAFDKAKDKNDYLIYDRKTGVMSYDADGSGKERAIEFAQLQKNLKAISYKDFFII